MNKKALIVQGGWPGHQPERTAGLFMKILISCGFDVEVFDSLDVFLDIEKLKALHLIVPVWTYNQTELTDEQSKALYAAIHEGVGFAGSHGVGDSFRCTVLWQYITGGQFVGHTTFIGEARVSIRELSHPIMSGIQDFTSVDEHYYMHIDPASKVLAVTRYPKDFCSPGGDVDMPSIWTKHIGKGRIFYCSLGHMLDIMMTKALEDTQFVLMDLSTTRILQIEKFATKVIKDSGLNSEVYITTNRREALKEADYVVTTFKIGGIAAYESDYKIPMKYGVDQCVGIR